MAKDWDGVATAAGTRAMFPGPRKKGEGDGGGGVDACEMWEHGAGSRRRR